MRVSMLRLPAGLLLFCALLQPVFAASSERAPSQQIVLRTGPAWDFLTANPNPAQQAWFHQNVWRLISYSPYFDSRLSWFKNAWVYVDLYAIPITNSVIRTKHPDWIARDVDGNFLYVPYKCQGGSCPQFAADLSNPAFRHEWIHKAEVLAARGYRGLWIDDVNFSPKISDGFGHPNYPMTTSDWQRQVLAFLAEIRCALPGMEVVYRSVLPLTEWSSYDDHTLAALLASCDYLYLDPAATGSPATLRRLVARLDSLNKSLILETTTPHGPVISSYSNPQYVLGFVP